MSKSKTKKEKDNRKKRPYRFALVGATASGKTCILAQLALNKDSGDRYSSSLASWDREKLSDRDMKLVDTDQAARLKQNYQKGLEMLRMAMKSIQQGEVPAPTPPGMNVRLMLDFEMGDSERGTFYVSTEDYSGENINASEDALANHETESYSLSQRLAKYDGLILVVDTFLQGEDTQKSQSMVQGINAFFATVKNNPNIDLENLPVALIFSKWDKYGPIDFSNPDAEFIRLEEYQKQEFVRFYNGIIKSVRNTVEEQERTDNDENYRVFPVSAFGKTRLENGNYVPELGAEAFGIVAPFVWMAERCDELNMVHIRKQAEKLPGKWKWISFWCPLARDVMERAKFLQKRVSKKKNYSSELKEIRKSACSVRLHVLLNVTTSFILITFLLALGIQEHFFSQWNSVVNSSSATISDLNRVKIRVEQCAQFTASMPWVNRPYQELLNKISIQMEESVWLPVTKSPVGSRDQMENAQKYLEAYDSGVHRDEAKSIVSNYRQRLDDEAWKSVESATSEEDKATQAKYYLDIIAKGEIPGEHKAEALKIVGVEYLAHLDDEAWKRIEETPDISEKVVRAEQYLKMVEDGEIPGNHKSEANHIINEVGPNYLDDRAWDLVKNTFDPTSKKKAAEGYLDRFPKGRHVNEAKSLISEIESEMAWQEDKKRYDAAQDMRDKEELLKDLVSKYNVSRWESVVREFPGILEQLLDRENVSSDEVRRITNCDQAITILENVETFVRGKSSSAVSTFSASQGNLKSRRVELIHQYDRSLYEKVPNSIQACTNYLEKMKDYGGGTMKSEVERMKNYFESLNSSCFFSGNGTVTWGNQITNHTARVEIHIDGSNVNSQPVAHNDGKVENLNDFNFSAIPNKSVTIEIKVISERNIMYANNKELHSGTKTISLRDWSSSGSVTIDIGTSSSVVLRLEGYPSKPDHPAWRER